MISIISFCALVASTLGCGVPQFQLLAYSSSRARRTAEDKIPNKFGKHDLIPSFRDGHDMLPSINDKQVPSVVGGHDAIPRIIDGNEALPWPWQVSIQNQTSNGHHFCGGSLINNYWILTAAHCEVKPRKHYVILGQNDRGSNNEFIQVKKIAKVITHPSYNRPTKLNNDISLLKLSSPVQMSSHVSPICLPSSSASILPGALCVTTGWGKTETGMPSLILQQATLPIVSQTECRQQFGQRQITDAMICAGAAGSSSCEGDSGGPLVCQSSGVWYQVGIVSQGFPTCDVDVPVIYAHVSYFRKWIDAIIRLN